MKIIISLFCLLLSTASMVSAMEPRSIHDSAGWGILSDVKQFVDNDPSLVNQADATGVYPLHYAAYFNRVAVAQYLLEHGANVNQMDYLEGTALGDAAYKGHETIFLLLLDCGAKIDLKGNSRSSATLLDAQLGNHPAIIQLIQEWPEIVKRYAAARLAFSCVLHPRVGAISPANVFPAYVMQEIVQRLRRSDFVKMNKAPK